MPAVDSSHSFLNAATTTAVTSRSLLDGVRQRDPDAWRRFVGLYGPIVYRWTQREGLREHDAADVVQDVFRAVAENIRRFEHRSASDSLRGWLWTITRNKIRDHYRRHQHEIAGSGGTDAQQRLQQVPGLPEEPDESPDGLAAELAHRALALMQSEFEASTWQAFWRTTVEGRSVADTARELKLTLAAVYKAKSRVLLKLRRELDGLLEGC